MLYTDDAQKINTVFFRGAPRIFKNKLLLRIHFG